MKILLCANVRGGRAGVGQNYMAFFSQFGEVVLVTASNDLEEAIKTGDILALPGGADVDPARYGEYPHTLCGDQDVQLEYLDRNLLEPWLKTGKPVIGICRGMQTLNVTCGGSLWQDLNHHVGGEDRTYLDHKLYTVVDGVKGFVGVNSYHHQGVKDLAPGFVDIGWSMLDEYCPTILHNTYYKPRHIYSEQKKKILDSKATHSALVEVMQHNDKPWVAFQYHPEDYNCPFALEMIEKTVKRAHPEFTITKPKQYKALGIAGGAYQEV